MSWPTIDETHDPARTSWVESANGHPDFPVQNLPFGRFSESDGPVRTGVAIGDMILDLAIVYRDDDDLAGLLSGQGGERCALRRQLSDLLHDPAQQSRVAPHLVRAADCVLHLPFVIGDYSDFYAGIHHARNVGALFRPDTPLLPNYKHVPIGYHGRASSVRPSGEAVTRPHGQRGADDFGPARRLDYELELGIWVGRSNVLGQPIAIALAPDHVAGFCLLNDWSARDIQAWEYQPLGPFLAKSFHTTVSPWVVTPEALAPFHIPQLPRPAGDPPPPAYLHDPADQAVGAFAIELAVLLQTARMVREGRVPVPVGRSAARYLYWTVAQLVAHHSVNGCNLRSGDLLGTGTISGPGRDECGSLLEATQGGALPMELPNGEIRTFLEDGDRVFLSATARREGFVSIGFGPCQATIEAAR